MNLLAMTATPIPRSLVIATLGDVAVSALREMPPGREPIATRVVSSARLDEVVDALLRVLDAGERVFWVCPLIEEGDGDLAAVTSRFTMLAERLGGRVALLHGRLRGPAKEAALAGFTAGATPVLVTTTVIEVGIDIPEARVLVVESAQRFGLAQLHQLRGRVGRGPGVSRCVLLYDSPLGEQGRARLSVLRGTQDGFLIAEEDLRLRGPGEVTGTRQSGAPAHRLVDLAAHGDLVERARADAQALLARDPGLETPRGEAARQLLGLFDRPDRADVVAAG